MKKITFLAALLISAASFAQIAYTSFEEPGAEPGVQYTDLGDPNVAHDLINNTAEPLVDYIVTGNEIGFDASYSPYDAPSNGLTDGDWVGVTDLLLVMYLLFQTVLKDMVLVILTEITF